MKGLVSILAFVLFYPSNVSSLKLPSSSFCGANFPSQLQQDGERRTIDTLVMRKQKASDKRTRRLQKGAFEEVSSYSSISSSSSSVGIPPFPPRAGITASPMATANWDYKTISSIDVVVVATVKETAGRGRARKRSQVYSSLASYHTEFLNLLTAEYRAEVSCFFYLFS